AVRHSSNVRVTAFLATSIFMQIGYGRNTSRRASTRLLWRNLLQHKWEALKSLVFSRDFDRLRGRFTYEVFFFFSARQLSQEDSAEKQ
uniref:FHA domain-containing protein n=2 Tax=Parascaris univalens TaxID=6257 RepID=A0A915B1Z4_PARUN